MLSMEDILSMIIGKQHVYNYRILPCLLQEALLCRECVNPNYVYVIY